LQRAFVDVEYDLDLLRVRRGALQPFFLLAEPFLAPAESFFSLLL
jgi:hypothetical protein